MRVVDKAEDTAFDRFVARKFLSGDLAKDAPALECIRRGARAAWALNHPDICTFDEIGDHEGSRFIAMEYPERQTLKHVISRPLMELERMLTVAIDVALPNEAGKDHDHQSSNSRSYLINTFKALRA